MDADVVPLHGFHESLQPPWPWLPRAVDRLSLLFTAFRMIVESLGIPNGAIL